MPNNQLVTQEHQRAPLVIDDTQETKRYQEPERRGGCFSPTIVFGSCALGCGVPMFLAILLFGFVIITGMNTLSGVIDSIAGVFRGQPTTATVTSTQTIVNSVKPLGQLVSVSAQLAKADIRVEVREGFQNACGRTAYHVAQGAIEAGVDLTQLEEADISRDILSGDLSITLPAPQLTSCRIDFLDQYDRSTSACGPAWDSLRRLAQFETVIEFREDAIEGGILDIAQEEAEIVLTNFLQLATGQQVEVKFEQPLEPIYPPSCLPESPGGWRYDVGTDTWTN